MANTTDGAYRLWLATVDSENIGKRDEPKIREMVKNVKLNRIEYEASRVKTCNSIKRL